MTAANKPDFSLPKVVALIVPVVVVNTAGEVVREIKEVRMDKEPTFGAFKEVNRVQDELGQLHKAIELFTDMDPAFVDRLAVCDVMELSEMITPFFARRKVR
jgi:hypothetical protein